MNQYINRSKIIIDEVVNELYDFSKLGGLVVSNALTDMAVVNLSNVAFSYMELFKESERNIGEVEQEIKTLYFSDVSVLGLSMKLPVEIIEFNYEYNKIYRYISNSANFSNKRFNSFGFHYFPEKSIGITAHRDKTEYQDLISIFVLEGDAGFYLCKDRKNGKPVDSVKLNTVPGDLILLRAPRNDSENCYRPYHYVEPMKDYRLTYNIRRLIE